MIVGIIAAGCVLALKSNVKHQKESRADVYKDSQYSPHEGGDHESNQSNSIPSHTHRLNDVDNDYFDKIPNVITKWSFIIIL